MNPPPRGCVLLSAGLVGAAIVGAVLLTTLAGLGLTWLRIESEGLLGPVVLHAGINSVGALAAVLASRRSGRHQAAPTL